jgi:ribonuclease BN (tRNA processing enzyme)
MATYRAVSSCAQQFRRTHHTSSAELAANANGVQPKLLVVYHRSNVGRAPDSLDREDILLDEIR